jgi:hypothetical protein
MKKIYATIVTTCFILNYAGAQSVNFEWAKVEGKYAYDYGLGITTDNAGNVYIAGKYEENAIFSGVTLPNQGNHDIYVAQYSPNGNLNWIHTGGGYDGDYARCITTNKTNRVYIAGEIEGGSAANIIFPGSSVTLSGIGYNDLFIAAYDLSGNIQWAIDDGWIYNEKADGIALDNSGNIVVCGYFEDTTKFGSGPLIPSKGGKDILVAKYDASGNLLWMRNAGGPGRDEGRGIVCDNAGNIYVVGQYEDGAVFGSTTYTVPNTPFGKYSDGYIAKYDPSGNLLWVKKIGEEWLDAAWDITIDGAGKLYVTGEFTSGTFTGSSIYWSNGKEDMFIACYDQNGNCQWVNHGGGSVMDRGRGVGVDGSTILVTGQFGLSATFGSINVNAPDSEDVFIAAFDNSGNYLWLKTIGGKAEGFEYDGYESGTAICGMGGVVYATGAVLDTTVVGSTSIPGYTRTDIFLVKLSVVAGVNEFEQDNDLVGVYPNPASDKLKIIQNGKNKDADVALMNSLGQIVYKGKFTTENMLIDLQAYEKGVYFLQLRSPEGIASKKIIIQ